MKIICPKCRQSMAFPKSDPVLRCTHCNFAYDRRRIGLSPGLALVHLVRDLRGESLGGYLIDELIGLGGTGVVFKARTNTPEPAVVAFKLLHYDSLHKSEFLGLVKDEFTALSQLNHPNIVPIRDFGQKNDLYYQVSDFVEGVNFSHYLKSFTIEPDEAHKIMLQLVRAVDHGHQQGVIHGNLKPSNIIMGPGLVKVTDFGLARLTTGNYLKPNLVRCGAARETMNYAAPELKLNTGPVDQTADIYALGAIYYEMLCGRPPFGLAKRPSQVRPGVTRAHDRLIDRCLAPDPQDRYPSAAALLQDLEKLGSNHHNSKRTGFRSLLVILALLSMALYSWLEWPVVWGQLAHSPAACWLPAAWVERFAPEPTETGPLPPVRPGPSSAASPPSQPGTD